MADFSILRQSGISYQETTIVSQYAMVTDTPIKLAPLDALVAHAEDLRSGNVLPVGSVEYLRAAMRLAGIDEPANLSYPDVLTPFLCRLVEQRAAGNVHGRWFIKPLRTKAFTGFVFDSTVSPDSLDEHDRIQCDAFQTLRADERVWISEPVTWVSEFRYYVLGNDIRGWGRYDDGPDEAPVPDMETVTEMARVMSGISGTPAAFTLDVGVLSTGESALIECNDAWSIGYYKGTLSYKDYVWMLWRRWKQLVERSG